MFMVENWGWPQWVVALFLLGDICLVVVISGRYFDKPKTSWHLEAIYALIYAYILDCGGFFNTIRWPQVVWIIATIIDMIARDRLDDPVEISFISELITVSFSFFLFYASGFFA